MSKDTSIAAWYVAGKYEVIRPVGQGTFGSVYLVRHIQLGEQFALKLLKREHLRDDRAFARFCSEARSLLRVIHPGLAQFRDFGITEEGNLYLVTDFCEGIPLAELMATRGSLPPEQALLLVIQLLSVVEAVHQHGIVHGDLKPDNIMVQAADTVHPVIRLVDCSPPSLRVSDLKVSEIDCVYGAPCYLAPEQASGMFELDPRTDVYAAGILMYEMLSGRVPFESDSALDTLFLHLTEPVPGLPELQFFRAEIEACVFKALAKARSERYQSAFDFRENCEVLLQEIRSIPTRERIGHPARKDRHAVTPEATRKKVLDIDDLRSGARFFRHFVRAEKYDALLELDFSSSAVLEAVRAAD